MSLQSRLDTVPDDAISHDLFNLLDEKQAGKLIECLNDGFIRLVDTMGDDSSVVQAARVSYGAGTKQVSDDRTLIRYLMRNRHTTPLEMVELKFHVRVPMDCWRQWIRHRTASVNEYSTRYSEAIDAMQTTKEDEWRAQAVDNKQGSGEFLEVWPENFVVDAATNEIHDLERDEQPAEYHRNFPFTVGQYLTNLESVAQHSLRMQYQERLALGVAREQARKDLPLSTYTEAYWKLNLHNLLHFLELRIDSHAQIEIRTFATAIGAMIKPIVPLVWEAFEDYRLNAIQLSSLEIDHIRELMNNEPPSVPFGKRERSELTHKLALLGIRDFKVDLRESA